MKTEDFDRAFDVKSDDIDKVADWCHGICFTTNNTGNEIYINCILNEKKIGEIFQIKSGEYVFIPINRGFCVFNQYAMLAIGNELGKLNQTQKPDSAS